MKTHFKSQLSLCLCLAPLFFLLLSQTPAQSEGLDPAELIARMRSAYAVVDDYQVLVTIKDFENGAKTELRQFLYSFKRPGHIRLDLITPHAGAILIYPDDKGKVIVRLPGVAGFIPLHLPLDNPRLLLHGQRLDQTDIGTLIENMARSFFDERLGKVSVSDDQRFVQACVLAVDHFDRKVRTFYCFRIDKASWLPKGVVESDSDGALKQTIDFDDLKTNTGLSEQFIRGQ